MTATVDRNARIDKALAWHRDQLLDLSTRNPALHFPTRDAKGKLKPKRLEAQGMGLDELYRALVIEGRAVVFQGSRDALPEDEDDLPQDVVSGTIRKNDVVLKVPLTEADVQKRLVGIQRTNREFLEEQGVHCLYLTLGHLRWYEDKKTTDDFSPRLAPLLMIPVHLERRNRAEPFRMVYSGEELPENFTLNLKLREQGLAVPELGEADELTPSAYFQAVRQALKPRMGQTTVSADAADWFAPVSTTSTNTPWAVDDEAIALGFFSFAKIMMYNDLLPERWPQDVTPYEHPLVAPLLAGQLSDERLPDSLSTDAATTGPDVWHVLDADSSQAQAIEHVLQGHHLVLQGPPGTGKSQTITNMIAGLLAQNKKVLFVAEKEAALSVVEERLKRVGLEHAVLALHSKNASKTVLRDALQQALYQERQLQVSDAGEDRRLTALVEHLRALPEALNEPLGPLTMTPYDLMGRLQELQDRLRNEPRPSPAPAVPERLANWTMQEWAEAEQVTQELARWVAQHGLPQALTLWGSQKVSELPQDRARLDAASAALVRSLDDLRPALQGLDVLAGRALDRQPHLEGLATAFKDLLGAPDLTGLTTDQAGWTEVRAPFEAAAKTQQQHTELLTGFQGLFPAASGAWERPTTWALVQAPLRQILDLGLERAALRQKLLTQVQPAALDADVKGVRETLSANRGLLSIFNGAVRSAKKQAQSWMVQPLGLDQQLTVLQQVEDHQSLTRRFKALTAALSGWTVADDLDHNAALALIDWLNSDGTAVARQGEWPVIRAGRQALAALLNGQRGAPLPVLATLLTLETTLHGATETHQGLLGAQARGLETPWAALATTARWLADRRTSHPHWGPVLSEFSRQPALRAALKEQAQQFTQHHAAFTEALQTFAQAAALPDAPQWPLERLHEVGRNAARDSQALRLIVSWNQLSGRLQTAGLTGLLEFFPTLPPARAEALLLPSAQLGWYEALLEQAFAQRSALATFEPLGHADKRAQFRELDVKRFTLNRQRVKQAYLRVLPQPSSVGQVGVLQREFAKKKRLLPVRDVLRQAGQAIQAIKPVFMMSPLSIASFIPLGTLDFDVVIFDEASQVRPSDALGALLRAKQAVVVGDLKQLGPTNFFGKATGEMDEDADDVGLESLLALFEAQYAGFKQGLTWHYRSQHEALIQTSNEAFYDGELVTFPNASPQQDHLGLKFHHVDPRLAPFGRGGKRNNPGEAEAVVEAVLRHARQRPQESLAVVTFSAAQQGLIENLIDQRVAQLDEQTQQFFREDAHERFVVKNLENVQGDERDVIMISVGYGYALKPGGDLQFYRNFGPLGTADGWRRLNVLITRARLRIEVFANFMPEVVTGLDTSESHRGLHAFKAFLERCVSASTGSGATGVTGEAGGLPGQVAQVLRRAGYAVHEQVGTSASRIELAVEHPERPGRYVLGVEFDGPAYHRARSVRDRDRLREDVLRVFGWRIHRIWSVDWFRDPQRGEQALLAAVDWAVLHADQREEPAAEEPVSTLDSPDALVDDLTDMFESPPSEDAAWFGDVDPSAGSSAFPSAGQAIGELPSVMHRIPSDPYVEARVAIDSSGFEFHLIPSFRLAQALVEVVEQEGPIHEDLALRRLMHSAGVTRMGNRIRDAFQRAITVGAQDGRLLSQSPFLATSEAQMWVARTREHRPPTEQKLDYVSNHELLCAMTRVVESAVGITAEELPDGTLRILGFRRVTADQRDRVLALATWAAEQGHFHSRNGTLTLATTS
jgi:DNA polymerase III delta prime subunit